MNKGVEILLQRMDSNPDEFIPDAPYTTFPSKWGEIVRAVIARKQNLDPKAPYYDLAYLTEEEVTLLYDKILKIQGDNFTKHVMSTLLSDDSSEEKESVSRVGSIHQSKIDLLRQRQEEAEKRMQVDLMKAYMEKYYANNNR
jgi:hypothetical protein